MATKKKKAKAPDVCRLTVTIRGVSYTARLIQPEAPDFLRAWRLRRADGAAYVVADTADGTTCDCGDFVFRHDGLGATGCKHVRALRSLGLIDPTGAAGGPESWPAWTDASRYTVTR